jgi:hypothetical protein
MKHIVWKDGNWTDMIEDKATKYLVCKRKSKEGIYNQFGRTIEFWTGNPNIKSNGTGFNDRFVENWRQAKLFNTEKEAREAFFTDQQRRFKYPVNQTDEERTQCEKIFGISYLSIASLLVEQIMES